MPPTTPKWRRDQRLPSNSALKHRPVPDRAEPISPRNHPSRPTSLFGLIAVLLCGGTAVGQTILVEESFDDTDISARGWYDNTAIEISATEHIDDSSASAAFTFRPGAGGGSVHRG